MKTPVERVVYRALYRLARKFDKNPAAKSFVQRNSAGTSDDSTSDLYYNHVLNSIFNKKFFLLPDDQSLSFLRILREEARSVNEKNDTKVKVETGLSFMRKLTSIWKDFNRNVENHRPEGNEQKSFELLQADNTSISFLKRDVLLPGHVLLAHPLLSGPLHRSVILILENTEKGTYGLVVNRSTMHTLKPAVTNLPKEMLVQFEDANVAFGGMVRRLQYLHTLPNCGGFEIPFCSTPLYAGGMIKKVLSAVNDNRALISEFQFFVGCCCWRPNQLEEEMQSGYWVVAETDPYKLVSLLKTSSSDNSDSRYPQNADSNGMVDVYQYAFKSLGKDYEPLAHIPYWLDCNKIESL